MKRLWQILFRLWLNAFPCAALIFDIELIRTRSNPVAIWILSLQVIYLFFAVNFHPVIKAKKDVTLKHVAIGTGLSIVFPAFIYLIKVMVDQPKEIGWVGMMEAGALIVFFLSPFSTKLAIVIEEHRGKQVHETKP